MKPSWGLSPEERERRFRRSKHKKLKIDLDEEENEDLTESVQDEQSGGFLISNNATSQPSIG